MPRKAAVTHYQCAPAQAPLPCHFIMLQPAFRCQCLHLCARGLFLEGRSTVGACCKLELASPRSSVEHGGWVCMPRISWSLSGIIVLWTFSRSLFARCHFFCLLWCSVLAVFPSLHHFLCFWGGFPFPCFRVYPRELCPWEGNSESEHLFCFSTQVNGCLFLSLAWCISTFLVLFWCDFSYTNGPFQSSVKGHDVHSKDHMAARAAMLRPGLWCRHRVFSESELPRVKSCVFQLQVVDTEVTDKLKKMSPDAHLKLTVGVSQTLRLLWLNFPWKQEHRRLFQFTVRKFSPSRWGGYDRAEQFVLSCPESEE